MRLLPFILGLSLVTACKPDTDTGDSSTFTDDTGPIDDTGLPSDADADGQTAEDGDCDDTNPAVYAGATEVCDGVDNDCDGTVDPDTSVGAPSWYADADADTFGDPATAIVSCEQPESYVDNAEDCNDLDAAYNPTADESDCTDPNDYNCDGSVGYADADADGYAACDDCDDTNAEANPDGVEVCDDADNNCDGTIDEDSATDAATWYADADADGYGDTAVSLAACDAPEGYVASADDCDDANALYNPGADESDCTDPNDYNCDGSVAYADADADGYAACTDCDDASADVNTAAVESCDGIDNNCDGSVDEVTAVDAATWYADVDTDGYGDVLTTYVACDAPVGFVADATDCDDAAVGTNPGAFESCDGVDDDCDGSVDEAGALGEGTWYADADADTFGDAASPTTTCDQPTGTVADASDCDDTTAASNPDASELCDGADNDCDGSVDNAALDASTWYADADADAYGDSASTTAACDQPLGYVSDATDCDDGVAGANPGATEVCDGYDNDCNGSVDAGAVDAGTWYADADADTYGDSGASTASCSQPAGYVADATDCDDDASSVHPGVAEICDGVDQDCDGSVDDGLALVTQYVDADGDGYGSTTQADVCDGLYGYADNDTDCDDTDADAFPGNAEADDLVDNDCDEWVDEDFVSPGDVIITEVARQPRFGGASTVTDGQWFEVYNTSSRTVDLSHWYMLRTAGSSSTNAFFVDSAFDIQIAPGDYAVFCKSDLYETGTGTFPLMCDGVWSDTVNYASTWCSGDVCNNFNLQRDTDRLAMYINGGSSTGTLIDDVTWSYTGTNNWPRDATYSMSLDPAQYSKTGNDVYSSWCSTAVSASDKANYTWWVSGAYSEYGTPGAANYDCP